MDLGRLVVLVVKKEVLSGHIEVFTLTAIVLIVASFISNLSHLQGQQGSVSPPCAQQRWHLIELRLGWPGLRVTPLEFLTRI